LPLTISLLSASIWDPPLAGKCEGGLSLIFYARCCAVLPLTNASLTTVPSCLPPRRHVLRLHHVLRLCLAPPLRRVAPLSRTTPVAPLSRAAHVASHLRHASPLLRQPPSSRTPLSRRAFVTPRPCRVNRLRHARPCRVAPSSRVASPRRDARFGPAMEMEESVSGRVGRVECKCKGKCGYSSSKLSL
jgi:hypothetical protein